MTVNLTIYSFQFIGASKSHNCVKANCTMNSLKHNVCATAGGPSWNVKGENCCSTTFQSLSINLLPCVP